MKKFTRLTALLLCVAMLLGMLGCTQDKPAETAPPTTAPVPTEPSVQELYADAGAALSSKKDLSLELLVTRTTTVAGDVFSEQSQQTLTWLGLGTEEVQACLDEQITFSVHNPEEREPDEEENPSVRYTEVYAGGKLYASMEDTYHVYAEMTVEEITGRYLPVVLLDAGLYAEMTAEDAENMTVIHFAQPTAAETWAVPETAELLDASGSATVNAFGALVDMEYTVTYQYGPAEVKLEVRSTPQVQTEEFKVPATHFGYQQLQYVDALRKFLQSSALLAQSDAISTSYLESMFCQAAGIMRNQSTGAHMHGRKEETIAKFDTSIYFRNYGTNETEEYEQEEVYVDGKYTTTVNKGLPTSSSGVSYEDIREYAGRIMLNQLVSPDFWEDVTVTDLGSVYLMEFVLNDNFGNTMQNSICQMLWEDPAFLYNLASAYENKETTGYLAVDKYTGLPTASGIYYEGVHTIDGEEYTLSLQKDQSVEAPAKGAYFEITEEMPEEAEPENKPTPLFYRVTGENGQQMWLLGTIHVGDERTAYLPAEIYDAFVASDALALEINSKAFDEQIEEDDALQEKVSDLYYFSDGTTLDTLMEEEEYTHAVRLMKASGNYTMNSPYLKPSMWSNSIENFYRRQGYGLHGDQGVEERLHKWAEDLEKEILEVESSMFQLKMMTGYSMDLQLLMLTDVLEIDGREFWEDSQELYEMWCRGDEEELRELLSDEVDTSEMTEEELAEYEQVKPLLEEYNKAMSYDRNDGMLKKAIEYLESGKTVFYAVGLAHLLNNVNGLVDALREAGYTVELVSYQ